jgi:tetratricopeptide (TPR) repeat protein
VHPEFAVTNENAPAVAAICHRLEGLPLAIELAAARSKLLSPEALLGRLARRLPLLVGGARDLPARHQTLRAAIAWSYDLLTEAEQRLFRRLAVFVGGCTLEAAETVAEGGLDLLASLVDKSLLRAEEATGGERRLGMLETIREFAQECLAASGESEALRRRHAEYFVALAEAVEPQLVSPEAPAAMDRLDGEHVNLRAVLAWSIEGAGYPRSGWTVPDAGKVEIGLRVGGAVQHFWANRGYHTEGRDWLARLLALDASVAHAEPRRTAERAKALHGAAQVALFQGDLRAARLLYQESLSITRAAGDRKLVARSLNGLGVATYKGGDFEVGRAHHEAALAIWRELGDRRRIGNGLHNLGFIAREHGDLRRAETLLEEGAAIHREMADAFSLSDRLEVLGTVRIMQGDYPGALALLEEALTLTRRIGFFRLEGNTLRSLGLLSRYQGELEVASSWYAESIRVHQSRGDRGELMQCLVGLGCVVMASGERASLSPEGTVCDRGRACLVRGTRLFGAAEALRESTGRVIWSYDRAEHERCVTVAREALGEAAFAAASAEGRALSLDQACALALEGGEP